MNKHLNFITFGHNSYHGLSDNIKMLSSVLKDFGFHINIDKKISKKQIQLIYEGHSLNYENKVIKKIKDKKLKKILVCTEQISFSLLLPKKFYTFNNFKVINSNFKGKLFYSFLKLITLHFQVFLYEYLIRGKKSNGMFKENIRKKMRLNSEELYWKQRYNFFINILPLIDALISTYDSIGYRYLKFKKYIFIPHLFSNKDLKFKKNKKKYSHDILFTGEINDYRKKILNDISKYAKIVIAPINQTKSRSYFMNRTKLLIGLKKKEKQNLQSTNRTYFAIKNRHPILNEKCMMTDHLETDFFLFTKNNLKKKIKNVLKNFNDFETKYIEYCQKVITKYSSKKYKFKIIRFFNSI